MLTIQLIRHGKTYGNTLFRYIGTTDEPLCEEGITLIKNQSYPSCEGLYCSPMLRCIETAALIYPNVTPHIIEDLKECNFGDFENKNYIELKDNEDYNRWVQSRSTLPFPNGETKDSFTNRTLIGFHELIEDALINHYQTISLVAHGGTIMSILSSYATVKKDYYDWGVQNGDGYVVTLEKELYQKGIVRLEVKNRILELTKGSTQ